MNFTKKGKSALHGLSYSEVLDVVAKTCEATGMGPKAEIIKCLSNSDACSAMSNNRKQAEAKICYLDDETQERLASGEYQFYDALKYSRINVIAGQNDFFKTDDTLVTGIRNIEKRKLPKDQPMIVTAIRLGTQTNATPPATVTNLLLASAKYYADLDQNETAPADSLISSSLNDIVACSEFNLRYSGVDVIYRDSCQRFNNYGKKNERGLWLLDAPLALNGDREIEVFFKTVDGITITPNSIFAEVQLIGFEARRTYHVK